MQPARLEPLSEARSAPRPEPLAAFSGLPEIPDAVPRRSVGKTAKASRRRFIGRIALDLVRDPHDGVHRMGRRRALLLNRAGDPPALPGRQQ